MHLFNFVGFIVFTLFFYCLVIPCLPKAIQYRIKMTTYYLHLLTHGFLVTFPSLLTPKNPSNFRYPMVLMWATGWIFGVRVRVLQAENIRQLPGNFVVVSNHQSSLDLIGISHVWPSPCTLVAKRSLLFAGWLGLGGWLCGCVFVSRGRQSALVDMRRLGNRLATPGPQPLRVWIFPEGTRCPGDQLGPFKKGAFHLAVQAQVQIVPVVFSNYANFYSMRERRFDPGLVLAKVLAPVATAGLTPDDVTDLGDRVRDAMNEALAKLTAEVALGQAAL